MGSDLLNAPVICNHGPPTYGEGCGLAGPKCGAIYFFNVSAVQKKRQGFDIKILTLGRFSVGKGRAKSIVLTSGLSPKLKTCNSEMRFTGVNKFLFQNIDCGYLLVFVGTCTHNLCFEQKYVKYQNFSIKISIFIAAKNLVFCFSY